MLQKTALCIAIAAAMLAAQPASAQSVLFEGARVIPGDEPWRAMNLGVGGRH